MSKQEGDEWTHEEIADLERQLANMTTSRDAAEKCISDLAAQLEGLQRELKDEKQATCDAERAFKASMIVTAYLASLL